MESLRDLDHSWQYQETLWSHLVLARLSHN